MWFLPMLLGMLSEIVVDMTFAFLVAPRNAFLLVDDQSTLNYTGSW
jgi:hypothetical protein